MEKKTWKRQAALEREAAPSPELFAGERILGVIEASLGDIGLLGLLMRRQERLVVTTHRILQYSTNFFSANLRCLELAKVETIEVGNKFNVVQLVAGVALLAGAVFLLSSAVFQQQDKLLFIAGSLLSVLAGSVAFMTAAKKVLQVSGSSLNNSIRLPLVRLGVSASKSFVDLVSGAVRNLSKAQMAAAKPTSRKPDEPLKNSRNGDHLHARARRATPRSPNPPYREPDEAQHESLNGKEAAYRWPSMPKKPSVSQPRQERSGVPNTPSHDDENYYEYRTSPTGEGWYGTTSQERRMYIE